MRGNGMLVVGAVALAAWVGVSGWVMAEVATAKPAIDTVARQQKQAPVELTGLALNSTAAQQ